MKSPESSILREKNPSSHSGEKLSNKPNKIGSKAIAATAELLKDSDVDVMSKESERKMNMMENMRALQKRFGERFVKGDLMEGGGYTGGAARELLARFMDRTGFADELKRLIPNKHGALQLLKDNYTYIQATLEQRYKDDPNHEQAPVRDPYELAHSVGYELTGPFTSTAEFVWLDRHDFRQGERLCTFNNPTGRLNDYHILWLRHAEVADTLPADQLTVETLSAAWKTYLKTIGRYDRDTDSYDLHGLRPSREDPYGISSMSVQISREGTHVSVKNRYNHTVGNPDNTLDSDLDNVAYGLKRAVYTLLGREDLMDKSNVALAEGYIADNEGGIHHYQYEENNIYYGDYEYIENGVVTTIDRGKYYMISPQLYVPISGKGDELRLGKRSTSDFEKLEVCRDVQFLFHSSKRKVGEKDQQIAELRRAYTERDHAELKASVIEHIRKQVQSTYSAYYIVAENLGQTPEGLAKLEQLFATKDKEWQESGVYDYLVNELIMKRGTRFSLVATPNVEATKAQVVALAEAFSKDQPYNHRTKVSWEFKHSLHDSYNQDDLEWFDDYNQDDLEWFDDECSDPIRLSLIPSRCEVMIFADTVDEMVEELRQRQARHPELNLHVPSVLEAIVYWYSLRAQGSDLSRITAHQKTCIYHIDQVRKWGFMPKTFITFGTPYLDSLDGNANSVDIDVRLAVG